MEVENLMKRFPQMDHLMAETLVMMEKRGLLEDYYEAPTPRTETIASIEINDPEEKCEPMIKDNEGRSLKADLDR